MNLITDCGKKCFFIFFPPKIINNFFLKPLKMSLYNFENELIRMNKEELFRFLRYNNLLVAGLICSECNNIMEIKKYLKVKDGVAWQCVFPRSNKYRKMISIRNKSFFEGFNIEILDIMKILINWACDQPQHSTIKKMEIDGRTYKKILLKFLNLANQFDKREDKLGGVGKIVQIDETGLNFKVKSHRGRSPVNKTDALCIIEFDNCITRAFTCVIKDKKASTIIPIICDNVEIGSTIHTDEHRSYSSLNNIGFNHDTVCHKYEFVNSETSANTHAVESFNNELNLDIKRRKGVKTHKRPEFLNEYTWKFNTQ